MPEKKLTSLDKICAFFLLCILILAVFPLEQPGMLTYWHGTRASALFTTKFARLTILDLAIGGALATSLLSYASKTRVRYKNNFGVILVLFSLCIIWGYLGTIIGDKGDFGSQNLGFGNWKKLAYGMLLFVILTLFLDSRYKIERTLLVIAAACVILDIYGLFRYFAFGGIRTEKYTGAVVLWETVKLGLNAFVFILSVGLLTLSDRKLSVLEKWVYRLAMVLAVTVIMLSSRRTSMIMLMIASVMIIILMISRGHSVKILSTAGVGIIVLALILAFNFDAFQTKFVSRIQSLAGIFGAETTVDTGSTQGHLQDLINGWEIVKENPIWGVGFAWEERSITPVSDQRGVFWVHNALLTFWMRFGILGVISYVYLYWKVLTVLWRSFRRTRQVIPFIFFTWFFVEFLSGFFFPPFFGYFKSAALFLGTLAISNAWLNVQTQQRGTKRQYSRKKRLISEHVLPAGAATEGALVGVTKRP